MASPVYTLIAQKNYTAISIDFLSLDFKYESELLSYVRRLFVEKLNVKEKPEVKRYKGSKALKMFAFENTASSSLP